MAAINISVPDAMREFVEVQTREGGFSTVSEYFRYLIRREQQRVSVGGSSRAESLNALRAEVGRRRKPGEKISNRDHDKALYK